MELREILAKTGDSSLLGYTYEQGKLTLSLKLTAMDARLHLTAPTDIVRVGPGADPTCFVELADLRESLAVRNGVFVPDPLFGRMMREIRTGASLAYGRRSKDWPWLLAARGNDPLVACLVRDPQLITWESAAP